MTDTTLLEQLAVANALDEEWKKTHDIGGVRQSEEGRLRFLLAAEPRLVARAATLRALAVRVFTASSPEAVAARAAGDEARAAAVALAQKPYLDKLTALAGVSSVNPEQMQTARRYASSRRDELERARRELTQSPGLGREWADKIERLEREASDAEQEVKRLELAAKGVEVSRAVAV